MTTREFWSRLLALGALAWLLHAFIFLRIVLFVSPIPAGYDRVAVGVAVATVVTVLAAFPALLAVLIQRTFGYELTDLSRAYLFWVTFGFAVFFAVANVALHLRMG